MSEATRTSIDSNTHIGAVALRVTDLDRSLDYYRRQIGLQLNRRDDTTVTLGAGGKDLLQLIAQPGAKPVQSGHTGLYHFALLVPERLELACTLQHLIDTHTPIGGASDHGVSEALYLSDPDGHGIEIYRDRPRNQWPNPGGHLQMTVDPLDARGLLAELNGRNLAWNGIHGDTTMGHIHLHVADIGRAEHFYMDVLGFDRMQRFGASASFISAGGYHHHIGLNIWAGQDAPPPLPDAARLESFQICLPNQTALDRVLARVREQGLAVQESPSGYGICDSSQNLVLLTV